jgi:hypothetical protein
MVSSSCRLFPPHHPLPFNACSHWEQASLLIKGLVSVALFSAYAACWVRVAVYHSAKVRGCGCIHLTMAHASRGFNPQWKRRMVPWASDSHPAHSWRCSNVAMYVSKSSPFILILIRSSVACSRLVVSMKVASSSPWNVVQMSSSSGWTVLLSTACWSTCARCRTQLLTFGPFM